MPPQGKAYSEDFVRNVYKLHDEGTSVTKIASAIHVNRVQVYRFLSRIINFTYLYRKPKRGRKLLHRAADLRRIALAVKRDRFRPATKLAADFHVKVRMMQRRMHLLKLPPRPVFVDVLTAKHKRTRVQWCKDHKNETFAKWIFSDESMFENRCVSYNQMCFMTVMCMTARSF